MHGRFPDTVARPYRRQKLAVPYRSLVPKKVENLVVAGRCISADDAIMGRLRLIPVCSATGEAAGVAAALAVAQKTTIPDVDVDQLREKVGRARYGIMMQPARPVGLFHADYRVMCRKGCGRKCNEAFENDNGRGGPCRG